MISKDLEEAPTDNHIMLIGRPPIGDYLRFVKMKAVEGFRSDDERSAEEWKRARGHIRELESSEGGWADNAEIRPLPESMRAIADSAIQAAPARRALRYIAHRWGLVPVDRLVVFQKWINLRFVQQMREELPSSPTDADLIRVAIGSAFRPPHVRVTRPADNTFCFSSKSLDLRFLDVVPLDPSGVEGYEATGVACQMVGIFIGYGLNFVSAFRTHNRLILSNGSHRVYALREMGITHVPCLVRDIVSDEDFDLVVPVDVRKNIDEYVRAKRPPLFKDYFDEQLRKIVPAKRLNPLLELELTFKSSGVPEL